MADELKRVGLVFKADGTADFKKSLAQVNTVVQENRNAFNLAKTAWDESTTAMDKLKDRQEYLTRQTETYSDKVTILQQELSQLESAEKRDEQAIRKKQNQLTSAQISLTNYQKGLADVTQQLESGSAETEQALRSLMNLCVKAERSEFDVRRLLERWGVAEEERQRIVDTLVRERFVDNRRYAEAYVREKVRFSGWGRYKIRAALRAKRIDESIVEEALEQVDGASMREKLEHRLQMKMNRTKSRDAYDLRGKLVRYGAGLGFDTDTVLEVVERLMKERGEITEN